ncbi:MAG: CPBP family intramembrane metalloprotease [Bacilli bacterium]|nr:CPBP family intramembrane metalloprotease [Bacilli bacterium]
MKMIDKKINYIIRGILVFLIFWYSKFLQYIPIYIFKLDIKNMSNTTITVLSTFSTLILFFIYFLIYRKELKKDFKNFIKNKEEYTNIGFRYWMIGILVMMITNFILNFVFKIGGANNEKTVQAMIKAFPVLMIIDAGILAPFNEEIVFRKTLKDIFDNKWIFIILSFLLFGGAHVISSTKVLTDYLYIIPYGALGAAFAYSYYKTNNIFTSIFMHTTHNLILIMLSIFTSLMI